MPDRLVWYHYYAKRYNETLDESAAVMAMWYLLPHLAFDGEGEAQ